MLAILLLGIDQIDDVPLAGKEGESHKNDDGTRHFKKHIFNMQHAMKIILPFEKKSL